MSKIYNEKDSMIAIKGLLNLLYGDAKRFQSLRNKFKKSVSDFKVKDGVITEVYFNAISNVEINKELESAIESARGYISRSAKKLAQFEALIALETPVDTTKPKSIKVAKVPDGKIKKVEKESSLPKEVKKVKNKNEPTKQVKKAVKAKPTKASKVVVSSTKEESPFKGFIESLSKDDLENLTFTIMEAFSGDTKLNQTMENWIAKTSNDVDAAIGMFSSAYNRKPKNQKMQAYYKQYDNFKGGVTIEVPTKKENEPKEPKTPKVEQVETPTAETQNTFEYNYYENIFGTISITKDNSGKFNPKLSSMVLDTFKVDVTKFPKSSFKVSLPFGELAAKYLEAYAEVEILGLELDFESEALSKGIFNCFTSKYIYNLEVALPKSAGFFAQTSERTQKIETILKEVKLKSFTENIDSLTQTETYIRARKICNAILKVALESGDPIIINNYNNILGEVIIRSSRLLEATTQFVMDSEESKDEVAYIEDTNQTNQPDVIKYNITSMDISFVFQNTTFTITKLEDRYQTIRDAVVANDQEALNQLLITKENLESNIKDILAATNSVFNEGEDDYKEQDIDIKIVDKNIVYNGRIYKGRLSSEFIKYLSENNKDKIRMFKKFIQNCNMNPSHTSVEELYDFVHVNRLGVTPTGTIILYKWVDNDYKDCHTHTFINTPGVLVKMDRKNVNADRNVTCSKGLHLCSYGYGKFGTRLLLCEVHPRDVVSIPTDYNRSKLRCCQYITLIDITEFYGSFNDKDFISIADNLHYNPKILEFEMFKTYPTVSRINSVIPELNGLTGQRDLEKIREILFSKGTIVTKKDKAPNPSKEEGVVSDINNINQIDDFVEETQDELKVFDVTEDENIMAIEEAIGKEEPEISDEYLEGHVEPAESSGAYTEYEEEEEEKEPRISSEKFVEWFNTFLYDGLITDNLLDKELFFTYTLNLEKYGFDGIIKDICITNINIDTSKLVTREQCIGFYDNYRNLILDTASATHITDEKIEEAQEVQVVEKTQNPDDIKIVDHAEMKNENVISKVAGFFKKLF